MPNYHHKFQQALTIFALLLTFSVNAFSADAKKPSYPPHVTVLKDYTKVVSTADGKKSLYTIWVRKTDNQMLAELPSNYASKKYFFATTLSSGEKYAGLQGNDILAYWRKYDKRLALISPNIEIRSSGDTGSKSSIKRLFTDRLILDIPIITMGPSGGPIIDMDSLLVGHSSSFFGRSYNSRLITIKKAKAFPENVELAFEVPDSSGTLKTLHYSISALKSSTGFKSRKADTRIGYFTTAYSDYGKYSDDETRVRYINRWHLEKADSKLKLSPPKKPIIFYIEHTTPIRYRRWVKEGILSWNKAFEKIGFSEAVEVYYQDKSSGAHMEKDPEDVRYNFVRWLNNNQSTAIGPSRVNPMTGEILDADIILTDGWIRYYRFSFDKIMPKLAMQGYSPETLTWLAKNPQWDPRVRLAPASKRPHIIEEIAKQAKKPLGSHASAKVDSTLIGDDEFDGLIGRTSQINGLCLAANGFAFDMAFMRLHQAILNETYFAEPAAKAGDKVKEDAAAKKKKEEEEKKKKEAAKKKKDALLDGMPEEFIGPLLAHLVAHEVGHTIGLRHNFKGSSIYTYAEINSDKIKGKKPLGGSVMDYTPININMDDKGKPKGDYAMTGIGPYDMWAIEYGYTSAKDLKPILARVAEPQLAYGTDEDTTGPDPLSRRFDFSKNPLDYANAQVKLANFHRSRLIDKFVKDGQSWAKASEGYGLTLSLQFRSVFMMSGWVGGVHIHRDKKGDKNGRKPIEVVSAKQQRDALKFVLENSFRDEAYGLTPKLMQHMTHDKWMDGANWFDAMQDATFPVHDRIVGLQTSVMSKLMNPTTLRRVYDNEMQVDENKDALTLAELLETINKEVWSELDKKQAGKFTTRKPMISTLRQNLQSEYLSRLISLALLRSSSQAANKPISNLALLQLQTLKTKVDNKLKAEGKAFDIYTRAHLAKISSQIGKTLEAHYVAR